jgi:Mrp family chromosome partitioning ATPase
MDQWKTAAEQLAVSQTIQGTRLLGVIAPTAAANSPLLAHMVAEAMGRSGLKVLLVDLHPEDGGAVAPLVPMEPWRPIQPARDGAIDVLLPNLTTQSRDAFNNSTWLGQYFSEQLRQYSNIVLDLPPVLGGGDEQLMPLAAASICNAIILMCSTGQVTYGELENAVQLLRSARAPLMGVVVEEGSGDLIRPLARSAAGPRRGAAPPLQSKPASQLSPQLQLPH